MPNQPAADQSLSGEDLPALRVLIWCPRGTEVPGGHIVQLRETARALRGLGVVVSESTAADPEMGGIDLVHGCGLNAAEIHRCRELGLPVLLSTIYWERRYRAGDRRPATFRAALGAISRATRLARASLRSGSALLDACLTEARHEVNVIAAYEAADMLLPNAEGEGEALRADLGVETPMSFVPNGVDPSRFEPGGVPWAERDTVLFVGRIEPHKNQLGLIEALRGRDRRLIIAGVPHPHHPDYLDRCRRAGEGWVTFRELGPSLDQNELPALYRSARVHVLPSWFETTGLVSLEAALSGCSIVTTSRGYAREYLGDLASYCDPADARSIAQAVDRAWNTRPEAQLRQRVLSRYTWHEVANTTLAAYREVLDSRRARIAETTTA